jgi:hypothetical protein
VTRKNKLERAKESKKFKPLVVDVTDDENFHWLHSMRTPEEKKRDREYGEQLKRNIESLKRREESGKN